MYKPKFKIGDKVRVLDGSKIEDYAGGWSKMYMPEQVGKEYKILGVLYRDDKPGYLLDSKIRNVVWDERGLELIEPENTPKFKVGDRVKVVKIGFGISDKKMIGKKFTVTDIKEERGVGDVYELDDPIGFSWLEWQLKLIADFPKIVITTDGKTTLARLYDGKKVIKTAEAHCSPDDKFDFSVGANWAMERLIGKVTAIQVSAEIPKEITDKLEAIKATGKAFVKALEEFK